MTKQEYLEAIQTAGKYVLLVDNPSTGYNTEVQRVFDTPKDAHEYASARIAHTKTNKIDIYETTGQPPRIINGCTYRDDIKPYQQHHIGINW